MQTYKLKVKSGKWKVESGKDIFIVFCVDYLNDKKI